MPPENIPAVPIYIRQPQSPALNNIRGTALTPAMARPTIKVVEFCATAQIRLPTSNMNTAPRKADLMSKRLYMLPNMGWSAVVVRKYAEPSIHPASQSRSTVSSYRATLLTPSLQTVSDNHQTRIELKRKARLTISLTLWNSAVIAPSAGAIIVWSSATRKMHRHSATSSIASLVPFRWLTVSSGVSASASAATGVPSCAGSFSREGFSVGAAESIFVVAELVSEWGPSWACFLKKRILVFGLWFPLFCFVGVVLGSGDEEKEGAMVVMI